jgi:hypothetical protein
MDDANGIARQRSYKAFKRLRVEVAFRPILDPPDRIPPQRFDLRCDGARTTELLGCRCRWILYRKNTGYHTTDPKIRTQGAERGRSWIAMKHGDESLESSNTQHTAERDTELYPGSGPSW